MNQASVCLSVSLSTVPLIDFRLGGYFVFAAVKVDQRVALSAVNLPVQRETCMFLDANSQHGCIFVIMCILY